jgi:hypothetical protein
VFHARQARAFPSVATLCAAGACSGGGGGGGGSSNVDQDFTPSTSTCGAGISPDAGPTEYAMTFTVGRSGLLTQIDFLVIADASTDVDDVEWELRPTIAAFPDGDDLNVILGGLLSTSDWPPGSGDYGLVEIDLSAAGLLVASGEMYALVLRPVGVSSGGSWGGSSNPGDYTEGDGFYRDSTLSSAFIYNGCDYGFRTHVE